MADFIEQKESKVKVVYQIEEVFREAAKDLVAYRDWKFLGRRLGLSDGNLEELVTLFDARDGRRETVYQMLCEWKKRAGKEANLPKLVRYLRAEEFHGTADLVSVYEVREQCTRCSDTGHRRCSHERIPSHMVTRSKSSLNLQRTKTVINFPVLPNIKNITPRVDSGLGRKNGYYSRSNSVNSTPCSTPTPRSRSVSLSSMSSEPLMNSKPPLPPINSENGVGHEAVDDLDGPVQMEPEPEPEVLTESEMDDHSPEPETDKESVQLPEPEMETDQSPEPEVTSQEPEVTPAEEEPEKMNGFHGDEADEIENEKKTGRGADAEPPQEPAEKFDVTATVNVTEIRPLPADQNPFDDVTIPPSIADMFKSMALHLYQTIVKNKEDNAVALQSILELRDFLVKNITIGSIKLEMECYSSESYEELKKSYLKGSFKSACEAVFATEEVLRPCGILSVKLEVEMAEFDNLGYEKEDTQTELTLDLEGKDQTIKVKDKNDKKDKGRRRSSEIEVTIDVKASFQAQIRLDLTGASTASSTLDDKLRLGKARAFHKLISSPGFHGTVIENLNNNNTMKNLIKFKSINPRGDHADLIVTCNSKNAIQAFYDFFLRKDLTRLLERTLLTRKILREANLDEVKIDVDVDSDHIDKSMKKYAEKVVKAKGTRYEK